MTEEQETTEFLHLHSPFCTNTSFSHLNFTSGSYLPYESDTWFYRSHLLSPSPFHPLFPSPAASKLRPTPIASYRGNGASLLLPVLLPSHMHWPSRPAPLCVFAHTAFSAWSSVPFFIHLTAFTHHSRQLRHFFL